MRSFGRQIDNRRSIFLNLIGSIESQLRQAYAARHDADGMTQESLGEKIGVGRSVINRRLTGGQNMTIETIADMVWGLDRCIRVEIYDPSSKSDNEFHIVPKQEVNIHSETKKNVRSVTMSSVNKSGDLALSKNASFSGPTSFAKKMELVP